MCTLVYNGKIKLTEIVGEKFAAFAHFCLEKGKNVRKRRNVAAILSDVDNK